MSYLLLSINPFSTALFTSQSGSFKCIQVLNLHLLAWLLKSLNILARLVNSTFKSSLEKPGESAIYAPFTLINSTSRVWCLPLPSFSLKSPILLSFEFNNELISEDFPTADCPHKTTFLFSITLLTSSIFILWWLDTSITV